MSGTTCLAAASAPLGDLLAVACVAGMALFGAGRGLFVALLAGLVVLAAFFAGMMAGPPLAAVLESFDCPAGLALPLAVIGVAVAVAAGGRVLVGGAVGEDDLRLGGLADKAGGLAVGAMAGWVLAGALQVAWSMGDLPVRIQPPALRFDAGGAALRAFARAATTDRVARQRLLDGGLCRECDPARSSTPVARLSEPFDDRDGNGRFDEGEPFLDTDGDAAFTADRPVASRERGDAGVGGIGVLDRYRLACWRRIRLMHAPRLTSAADSRQTGAGDGVIYRITAEDADGDQLTYGIEEDPAGGGPALDVDPATGDVRLRGGAAVGSSRVRFRAVVTDASGLRDEKAVGVTVAGGGP